MSKKPKKKKKAIKKTTAKKGLKPKIKQILTTIKTTILAKKLIFAIAACLFLGIVSIVVFATSTRNEVENERIIVKLLGEEYLSINMYEEYESPGAVVVINGLETDEEVEIVGEVDTGIPGEYLIEYRFMEIVAIRTVRVIDNVPPVITLKGRENITIAEGDTFREPGFSAVDNVDGDITDKVEVTGEVKKTRGNYVLSYTVSDSAGNTASATRNVRVIRPLPIRQAPQEEPPPVQQIVFHNEINGIHFINNGIQVSFIHERDINAVLLVRNGEIHGTYQVTRSGRYQRADIPLNSLAHGIYYIYINIGEGNERALNRLDNISRVARARKGNNLVTFNYANNHVQISTQPFAFHYDILIDVGHGGRDPGAVNGTHLERDLNLEVTLYEARRFREHGLRVRLNRNGNDLEMVRGDVDWAETRKRFYAIGHYGVVSRVIYSNHHNSSADGSRNGPEIIVPATMTSAELVPERRIFNYWINMTPNLNPHQFRFYTRNLDTREFLNKINGEVYNVRNWYGMNRILFELFNVKGIIFEPAYMSNPENFHWYWHQNNWIPMSERKIQTYVEYLGGTYTPPA